jgi:hypothetical protein
MSSWKFISTGNFGLGGTPGIIYGRVAMLQLLQVQRANRVLPRNMTDYSLYHTAYRGYNNGFYDYTLDVESMHFRLMQGVVGKVVCMKQPRFVFKMRDGKCKKNLHAHAY